LKGDEAIGAQIVIRAIEEPLRQLANNAGEEGSLIVQEVKSRKGWEGFDCDKLEYVDMGKAGIIDPTKVTRSALQNAASIAGLLLTTECCVTEVPEKDKPAPMPGRLRWSTPKWITPTSPSRKSARAKSATNCPPTPKSLKPRP